MSTCRTGGTPQEDNLIIQHLQLSEQSPVLVAGFVGNERPLVAVLRRSSGRRANGSYPKESPFEPGVSVKPQPLAEGRVFSKQDVQAAAIEKSSHSAAVATPGPARPDQGTPEGQHLPPA